MECSYFKYAYIKSSLIYTTVTKLAVVALLEVLARPLPSDLSPN